MADRYPQWKVDLFASRNAGKCICRLSIPGILRDRNHPDCPQHGWRGDPDAEQGRSIVENDAIQAEKRT